MKSNDVELDHLFGLVERGGMCLVPHEGRLKEALRRRVRQGDVVRPSRGMYARVSYWSGLSRADQVLSVMRTLQSVHPDWVFCCESAALAHGLSVSYRNLDGIDVVSSPTSRNSRSANIRWHVVENDDFEILRGIRVTSLARTVFDCMRTTDFCDSLAIADSALRKSGVSRSEFIAFFRERGRNHAGVSRAIRTMWYADALSESGGESIARAMMIRHGFALPQLQVEFRQPMNPSRLFRVDFLWTRLDGSRVIGEFDGMQKYFDESLLGDRTRVRALIEERHRESQLTLYGMPIVRLSYKDVADPGQFADILKGYGIPRCDEIARRERELYRSRSTMAQVFVVCDY